MTTFNLVNQRNIFVLFIVFIEVYSYYFCIEFTKQYLEWYFYSFVFILKI